MRVRALSFSLALGFSSALTTPVAAQQTALPDLPTIGERLAPFKASYEDIGKLAAQADEAYRKAAREAFEAKVAYREKFQAYDASVRVAKLKLDAAAIARPIAERAYRSSKKSDEQVQYPAGSENAKRQAREAAERRELKEKWDAAEAELKTAKAEYNRLILNDPLVEDLARKGLTGTKEQIALDNLAKIEDLLLKATYVYTRELLKYPPPYLNKIEVGDGATVYYAAEWQLPQSEAAKPSASKDRLLEVESQLIADIGEMDAILEQHAQQRSELAKKMQSASKVIVGQADTIENYEWAKAWAPIIIDSAAFAIDVFTTGGATTASGTVSDAISRSALEKAFLKNPRAAEQLNKAVTKGVGAISTEALNRLAGGKEAGQLLDNAVAAPEGIGIKHSGASILLSDAIETTIGNGIGNGTDALQWRLIKQGRKASLFGPGYLNAMKQAAPAAIVTSLSKAAVNKFITYKLDETREMFLKSNFEFEVSSQLYSKSLLADREMIELRKQLRASLASVQFQLALDGRSPVLVKMLDNGIPAKDLRDGKLTIRAFFNQPMSVEPIVKFGDDFLLDWKQIRERDGTQWIGTKLSGNGFEEANQIQLFVAASKGNDGHDSLDGRPSTVPELDFTEAKWTNFEQLADGNHLVKIAHPNNDLTGLWRRSDGTLFRFTHTGSRLESDYASRPTRFAHEIGGINFNGTIEGNRVTGRLLGRPQRVHYQRCKLDMFENFSFTLSDDLQTLSGTHGRSSYNTSNCRITSKDTMRTSYTRVLDEDGKPQR